MTTSLIPETAPFTCEQRAWLNGFLAGWMGIEGEVANESHGHSPLTLAGPPHMPQSNGQAVQAEEEEFPWHDDRLSMDQRLELAEGKPLERRLMAAMAQLDCGACGYVCRTYSEAIASGAEKNLTLCAPGGKETSKMLKRILKEAGTAAGNGQAVASDGELVSSNGHAHGFSRTNPFPAQLKETRNLNGPGSAKHTSHVVIDLAGSGLNYRVGDALGVYPTNCPELVDEILARVNFDRSNGAGGKLRTALMEEYDLSEVPEELVQYMISVATDPDDAAALKNQLRDDNLEGLDVLDVLELAPSVQIESARLVEHLSPLNPRLYSIASSPRLHTDEVHLTVAKVTYELRGRGRKGVASTMFADRLRPGDRIRVFVHEASDFTVPADSQAAMIMVGPGTGIAPFRAFLEERAATGATGKNWLFFGDQCFSTDFLYRSEFDQFRQQGILTRLDTAFSRDHDEKMYVQHRMLENGRELFAWLEEGAYFFVCGDARRMAVDVDRALHEIIATHGQRSADQAADYVRWLKERKRYVRDVY